MKKNATALDEHTPSDIANHFAALTRREPADAATVTRKPARSPRPSQKQPHPGFKTPATVAVGNRHGIDRGLTNVVSTLALQARIRTRILSALHRLRVLRTLDVTALCFAEREFKPALVAAQRAMRGLKKTGFISPYLTDRRQTVYGLTRKGARLLEDDGISATESVRRVSDMTNPEHLLWANFIVMCCEARGLKAYTETEFLQQARGALLPVKEHGFSTQRASRTWKICPDALAAEDDGFTWFELDRSKRGAERAAKLVALFRATGQNFGRVPICRVVVMAKTSRTFHAAVTAVHKAGRVVTNRPPEESREPKGTMLFHRLTLDSEIGPQVFAVYGDAERTASDSRVQTITEFRGHVIVQMLPLALARFRIDARNKETKLEWFSNGFLPYFRPVEMEVGTWRKPVTPLVSAGNSLAPRSRSRENT